MSSISYSQKFFCLSITKKSPSEVLLIQSFFLKGLRKNVLLSGCPSYPGYYLSKVFLSEKGKEVQGTEEKCITWGRPTFASIL